MALSDNLSNIRKILQWVAFAFVAYLLFRTVKACNGLPTIGNHGDTVKVVHDTVTIIERHDTTYKPVITSITTNTVYKPIFITDTLYSIEVGEADTAAILARYFQKVFYSDTQKVTHGSIIINDTVTRNRIVSRRLQTNITVPEITNTITLRQPKRLVMYFGVNGIGSQATPLFGAGVDLSVKWRDDRMFTIGAILNRNDIFYQTGVKWPIRLKKP